MWKKYFKTPFINGHDIYIYDANYHPVCCFLQAFTTDECNNIIKCINNEYISENENVFTIGDNKTKILVNDKPILLMRGFGFLTGVGGCNLEINEAIDVQNSLAEYICEQLNKK